MPTASSRIKPSKKLNYWANPCEPERLHVPSSFNSHNLSTQLRDWTAKRLTGFYAQNSLGRALTSGKQAVVISPICTSHACAGP